MKWYLGVLKKYAVFDGRASRKEYWDFALFNSIILPLLFFLDFMTGTYDSEDGIGLLSSIYSAFILIPSIAVTVRRLHDVNLNGSWSLIFFIPVIGFIVLLVFLAKDGTPRDNQFGSNPKEAAA